MAVWANGRVLSTTRSWCGGGQPDKRYNTPLASWSSRPGVLHSRHAVCLEQGHRDCALASPSGCCLHSCRASRVPFTSRRGLHCIFHGKQQLVIQRSLQQEWGMLQGWVCGLTQSVTLGALRRRGCLFLGVLNTTPSALISLPAV